MHKVIETHFERQVQCWSSVFKNKNWMYMKLAQRDF